MKITALSLFASLICISTSAQAHVHHATQDEMVAHLVFTKNNVHAHLYWDKAPTLEDSATLRVEFRNPTDHSAIDVNAALAVNATMPEMDHGDIPTAPPVLKKDENGNSLLGVYIVEDIFLYMPDKWLITLTLVSADGYRESQSFEFNMAGDSEGHHHH